MDRIDNAVKAAREAGERALYEKILGPDAPGRETARRVLQILEVLDGLSKAEADEVLGGVETALDRVSRVELIL